MGDTARDLAGHRVCGARGTAVAVPGPDFVYRRHCADDLFPDHAVPQANQGLGYPAKNGKDSAVYVYDGLSLGWVVVGA